MYYPFCRYRVWEFMEFSGKTREHMPSAAAAALPPATSVDT